MAEAAGATEAAERKAEAAERASSAAAGRPDSSAWEETRWFAAEENSGAAEGTAWGKLGSILKIKEKKANSPASLGNHL
jgi:hypothetical protein